MLRVPMLRVGAAFSSFLFLKEQIKDIIIVLLPVLVINDCDGVQHRGTLQLPCSRRPPRQAGPRSPTWRGCAL